MATDRNDVAGDLQSAAAAASLFARVPVLRAIPDPVRDRLVAALGERRCAAGEAVFAMGEPGDVLYLVVEGEVEIAIPTSAGEEKVTLRRLGPGEHFGEMALLDGEGRAASAVATMPTRLLTLTREAFLDPVLASPASARVVLLELGARLRATNALLGERASRDVVSEFRQRMSLGDRLAEFAAAWNGSWAFLAFLVAVSAAWFFLNASPGAAFDPYPFAFFNLVLAVLVVLQGPLLMMSQNREARQEREQAEADYRVNLKNEVAIERLGRELAALRREIEDRLPLPSVSAGETPPPRR